jgi:hypothetical protein
MGKDQGNNGGLVLLDDFLAEELNKMDADNIIEEDELKIKGLLPDEEDEEEDSSLKDKKDSGKPADGLDGSEKDDEDEEEESKKTSNTKSDLKDLLTKTFGAESFGSLLITDEKGEEQEINFEDADIDQETAIGIILSKIDELKQEAVKDKVSVKGLSEMNVNLIEAIKKGVKAEEVQALMQQKNVYVDALENIDTSSVDGQKEVLKLRLAAGGESEEDIEIKISGYEAKGILEARAEQAEKDLKQAVQNNIQKAIDAADEAKKKKEEALKDYKKKFKESLVKFELNDKQKEKLVAIATKRGEDGYFELDKVYNEKRQDIEAATELALFLTDREEFIKQITRNDVRKTQIEAGKKLRVIKRDTSETPIVKSEAKKNDGFMSIEEFID